MFEQWMEGAPRVLGDLGLRLKGLEPHVFLMRENSRWDGRLVLLAYSDKSPCLEHGDGGSEIPEDPHERAPQSLV